MSCSILGACQITCYVDPIYFTNQRTMDLWHTWNLLRFCLSYFSGARRFRACRDPVHAWPGKDIIMNDAADGKRKPRSIMATDSEWTRIRERAERERIPISRYVVRQSLATVERPAQEGRLPLSVQWRMARDIRVLLRLEELQLFPGRPGGRLACRGHLRGGRGQGKLVSRQRDALAGEAVDRQGPRPGGRRLARPGSAPRVRALTGIPPMSSSTAGRVQASHRLQKKLQFSPMLGTRAGAHLA